MQIAYVSLKIFFAGISLNTEGCKSRYTVIRVTQSKIVYLLLHPSVYRATTVTYKRIIHTLGRKYLLTG